MTVTLSNFCRKLFRLVVQALNGHTIEILRRWKKIRLVPELQGSELDRPTPVQILNPALSSAEHTRASRELLAEMQREWEKDWSEI